MIYSVCVVDMMYIYLFAYLLMQTRKRKLRLSTKKNEADKVTSHIITI